MEKEEREKKTHENFSDERRLIERFKSKDAETSSGNGKGNLNQEEWYNRSQWIWTFPNSIETVYCFCVTLNHSV